MRATFPAAARLHRPSEYASALKGRRLARGALFVVMTPRGNDALEGQGSRLGLIIAKRFAARAVTRNAIKRVLREAFRQKKHLLPERDLVFRLHSRIGPVTLTQLKKQVRLEADALLDKAAQ
ncbi:ribonuclease P protein component [Allopusillimonas ginsengisoli]|uniref:ribonuclease P protein component n=1 Tax=Allopusillimonas ginsengisoli TaxID=453575 RepID=UPI0010228FE1|nr:ribonuclease P protein component [Allopusillimonas ginsengisoli]TEA70313.1 ribonuclease P protein component [Allopusillimonas ginsengisoli]